jgi:hypothetical protein
MDEGDINDRGGMLEFQCGLRVLVYKASRKFGWYFKGPHLLLRISLHLILTPLGATGGL